MAINIDHTGAGQITLKSPSSGTGELTLPTGTTELASVDMLTELASVDMLLGVGQTWESFTTTGDSPQRQAGVTYTNTTGRPIMVNVSVEGFASFAGNSSFISIIVGGVLALSSVNGIDEHYTSTQFTSNGSVIVPPGSTYRVNAFSLASRTIRWAELR